MRGHVLVQDVDVIVSIRKLMFVNQSNGVADLVQVKSSLKLLPLIRALGTVGVGGGVGGGARAPHL